MNLLPRAWTKGRNMETYTYNDRQVNRIITLSLGVGVVVGFLLALAFSIPKLD